MCISRCKSLAPVWVLCPLTKEEKEMRTDFRPKLLYAERQYECKYKKCVYVGLCPTVAGTKGMVKCSFSCLRVTIIFPVYLNQNNFNMWEITLISAIVVYY